MIYMFSMFFSNESYQCFPGYLTMDFSWKYAFIVELSIIHVWCDHGSMCLHGLIYVSCMLAVGKWYVLLMRCYACVKEELK